MSMPSPTTQFPSPPQDPRYPPPKGSISYWQQGTRASPILNARTTTELPDNADVVIIGSGISGALVAWNLLHSDRPPGRVVMLEARGACSGATGKNAGHCRPDQYRGYPEYVKRVGPDQATKILENEWDTYTGLVNFIKTHGIDCDLWVGDTYDVPITQSERDRLAGAYAKWAAAGGDTSRVRQELSATTSQKVTRIDGALAYWAWPAATLHPIKLVYGILSQCLRQGLNLQTFTPATKITQAHSTSTAPLYTVHTDRGAITTSAIIHASNGFAPTLLPQLCSVLHPTPFVCTKLVPPPAYAGVHTLQNSLALWWEGGFLTVNPRTTSDGVMLFGGDNEGYGHLRDLLARHPESLNDDRLANYQPCFEAAEKFATTQLRGWPGREHLAPGEGVTDNWSGLIGQTEDDLPFVGRVPGLPGQYITAGHCGHGMARIFTTSAAVAKMVLDPKATLTSCHIPECFELTETRIGRLRARL